MKSYTILILAAVVACALGAPRYEFLNPWDTRIVGGTDAEPGEFPFIVSLRSRFNSHFCGGSIISSKCVITAAHCVIGNTPDAVIVVSGTTTLDAGGQTHAVQSINVHANYSASNSWKNDIAVIQLTAGIVFGDAQNKIPLPEQDDDVPGSADVQAGGWGYLKSGDWNLPNNLQRVDLKTLTNSQCQDAHTGTIHDGHICTYVAAGTGMCNGDSGGPLVHNGVLAGLVSWGRPCAVGFPDVYTRVSKYRDWIEENGCGN